MLTGQIWLRVPRTIKIEIVGNFEKHVSAKDFVLFLAGRLGASGANYKALEFCGEGIGDISIEGRFTISNMAVEMGAKAGIFPTDDQTKKWLARRTDQVISEVQADEDAAYEKMLRFELDKITPMVSMPHAVGNVAPVKELRGKEIQFVFIGACTNGGIESLRAAAEIVKSRHISSRVRMVIQPCSRETFVMAANEGVLGILADAGALINPPGCGPCCGQGGGIPCDGGNVLSTANRNFKGRMGNKSASIYLASPETAAASAIAGYLVDPRALI